MNMKYYILCGLILDAKALTRVKVCIHIVSIPKSYAVCIIWFFSIIPKLVIPDYVYACNIYYYTLVYIILKAFSVKPYKETDE